MKKCFFILSIMFFIFTGCSEKKTPPPDTMETPTIKESQPDKDDETEITGESFDVKKNVHHISMPSIKTGEVVSFKEYKGKKILFDFWSSWCEPCIAMFPVINKLKRELEDKQGTLKILSISVDPMKGNVIKIMEQKKVAFEVLHAPVSLANSGILMPFTAIADENGNIIKTLSGKHTYEEFLKLIEK